MFLFTCTIKFVYVVVPSIVAGTPFSRYFESELSYGLQMWWHQFAQAEKSASKILAAGHCTYHLLLMHLLHWFLRISNCISQF